MKEGIKMNNKMFQFVVYVIVIILSIAFIYFGNKIATRGNDYELLSGVQEYLVTAKVTAIRKQTNNTETGDIEIYFSAETDNGDDIIGLQTINQYDPTVAVKAVEEGDKVILDNSVGNQWQFTNYVRTNYIMWLGIVFVVLLLFFGRLKGLNTLISLGFTCLAVFIVFVPAVISGENIYIWSIVICIYTILMTILIVNGFNTKSFMAMLGCAGGVIVAGILTLIMNKVLKWNGIMDADCQRLILEFPDMDLLAMIFASVTIGAMGAVMDVAMSMASSLYELKLKAADISSKELYKSGMAIGRDMMGTMANTLVLAYIGSALEVTVLQVIYNGSIFELMNKEKIILEVMQAIVGSFGILLAIPFTAFICSVFYNNIKMHKMENIEENFVKYKN